MQPETETVISDRTGPSTTRMVLGLWSVVAVFGLVAIARSVQVGIGFIDPRGDWLLIRLVYSAVLFVVMVGIDGFLRTEGRRTWTAVGATVRSRWTRRRIVLAWAALGAYHLTYLIYHNLKSWDVFLASKDQMLLDWDRWLFFGNSPAVLLHDLLGQNLSAWVLRNWYEVFGTLVILSFPAAVVFAERIRDAFACIAAFVWVWILGTACYYLIPSQGPFDAAPHEFAGLPAMSIQETQARYMEQRAELLANPHGDGLYAQVSAFASLHVGVTAVILGVAWWYGMRRATIIMGIFLAGTMVATVYLGWHFAVDVPAGLAIAALAWWLGPRTVGVRDRPEPGFGLPKRG